MIALFSLESPRWRNAWNGREQWGQKVEEKEDDGHRIRERDPKTSNLVNAPRL